MTPSPPSLEKQAIPHAPMAAKKATKDDLTKPVSPVHPTAAPSPVKHPTPTLAEFAQVDGLVKGSAAVSAPKLVKEGEPFHVYLRVSPGELKSLLESLASDASGDATRIGTAGIKLTPRMTASVTGLGFEFTPSGPYEQAVSATDMTTWHWEAQAKDSGLMTLDFKLTGTLTVEGKDVPRDFYAYSQKVEVSVGALGFFERYWQWLVTTLLIPAAGGAWALLRRKSGQESGGAQTKSGTA